MGLTPAYVRTIDDAVATRYPGLEGSPMSQGVTGTTPDGDFITFGIGNETRDEDLARDIATDGTVCVWVTIQTPDGDVLEQEAPHRVALTGDIATDAAAWAALAEDYGINPAG